MQQFGAQCTALGHFKIILSSNFKFPAHFGEKTPVLNRNWGFFCPFDFQSFTFAELIALY